MSLIRRYAFVFVLFLGLLGAIVLPRGHLYSDSAVVRTPAPVIPEKATVIDQGVAVRWFPAQHGTRPISGYVIERSRHASTFVRIARVEKFSSEYIDADGRTGDTYRIIAEDTQQPVQRSRPGEVVTAAPARPGSNVIYTPQSKRVLGVATALAQADSPDAKAAILQNLLTQAFTQFDTALAGKDFTTAREQLIALQNYQRQILTLWPQLTAAQKVAAAQPCTSHIDVFETNTYLLSEREQLDGALVQAGCTAIKGDG